MDDEDDERRACPHCRMDKVQWPAVLPCTISSFRNAYIDLVVKRRSAWDALLRDDRVLYLIGVVIAILTLRLIL